MQVGNNNDRVDDTGVWYVGNYQSMYYFNHTVHY